MAKSVPIRDLHLSRKGAIFIGRFEGWVDHLYNDLNGDAHIGFGHRLHTGNFTALDAKDWGGPPAGHLSKDDGLKMLRRDAANAAHALKQQAAGARLTQAQFDALVSFVFNVGQGTLAGSPISRYLQAGQHADARKGLLRYDHDGSGNQIAGLTKRRRAEARLFWSGNYFLAKL